MIEITSYKFVWELDNNEGLMHLKPTGGASKIVPIDSPQEASLLLDVLRNEKPVFYDSDNNIILTGLEPVGEGEDDGDGEGDEKE